MKIKRTLKVSLGVIAAVAVSITIYQFAYSKTYNTSFFSTASDTGIIGKVLSTVTNQPELTPVTAEKYATDGMTMSTLATYNGQNGQPAYVAYEGIVYDLSALANWKSGTHHGVKAGTDITNVFSTSPHSKSIFKLAVVVGKLIPETLVQADTQVSGNQQSSTGPSVSSGTTMPGTSASTDQILDVVSSASTVSGGTSTSATASQSSGSILNASTMGTQTVSSTQSKVWTYESLSAYNGKNGQPAYIAVDGIIYDVSALGSWSTGTHHGVTAGQDVTTQFASSPHSRSILQQAVIIGQIGFPVDNGTGNVATTTTTSTTTTVTTTLSDDDRDDDDDATIDDDEDDSEDDHSINDDSEDESDSEDSSGRDHEEDD